MVQRDYFVAFVLFMSKKVYKYYKDRLSRCQSPSELLSLTRELKDADLSRDQLLALCVAAKFAAGWFDKKGYKLDETSSMECSREAQPR